MPDPQTMMAMQLLQQILMGASQEPDADDMGMMGDEPIRSGDQGIPPGAQAALGPPGIGTQGMPSDVPPGATMPPEAMPKGPKRPPVNKAQAKPPHAHKTKSSRDQKSYKALGKPPVVKPKANEPRK